jgi:membrane-associated phospholipid phosphatase
MNMSGSVSSVSRPCTSVRHCPGLGRVAARLSLLMVCGCLLGCGTLANGRGWGQDAIVPVSWRRVTRAAQNALFDIQTLIPAAGAIVFAATDLDDRTSEWAIEHTPVFGSVNGAQDASDVLSGLLLAEAGATALATPSGHDAKTWALWKAKGLAVELAAVGLTEGVTSGLKAATNRSRPDDPTDTTSFPSGHASEAFSGATLSNRNLDAMLLPIGLKRTLQVSNVVFATGAAWARVEGGKHFPSDVLAGAALGYFLSAFIHDAFLGLPETDTFRLVVFPARNGAHVEVSFSF